MNTQKLDEVKLTLQRLQRIADGTDEDNDAFDMPAEEAKPPRNSSVRLFFERIRTSTRVSRLSVVGAFAIAFITIIGVASWVFLDSHPDLPPQNPEAKAVDDVVTTAANTEDPAETDQAKICETAQKLIEEGQIREARQSLLPIASESPEAALVLARSYDPNYLSLIPEKDAAPDTKEAERWYRTWWEVAAKRGLALDTDRLDRIINAMH